MPTKNTGVFSALLVTLIVWTLFPSAARADLPDNGGPYAVCVYGACGYVDDRGEWIITPDQGFGPVANPFDTNGLAWVGRDNGALVQINRKGEVVRELPFRWVGRFNEHGLARTYRIPLHEGIIDREGRVIVGPDFWDVSMFASTPLVSVRKEVHNGSKYETLYGICGNNQVR